MAMTAKGSTNMSEAIALAAQQAKRAFAGNRINRVLLITDGHVRITTHSDPRCLLLTEATHKHSPPRRTV
jgi:Mg-chelatase subunit ChlD